MASSLKATLKSKLWAPIKAKIQEKQIKDEYHYYLTEARKLNIDTTRITDNDWVQEQLLQRLAKRSIPQKRKKKGDLHILYLSPGGGWERVNIPPELQKIGKLSIYFTSDHGFRVLEHDYLKDWLEKRHTLDKAIMTYVEQLHKKQPIDIIVSYLSGWHIAPETIWKMNNLGIFTCAFWFDDRLMFRGRKAQGRYEGSASVAAAYDMNMTMATDSIVKYFVEGGLAIFWPEAANSDFFKPFQLPFKYDVSFIGTKYGMRPVFINYLKKHNINVEAFGQGWKNGELHAEEMVKVYAQSKINLGFGGIGYSMKETNLKGRDFEVPMCGSVYLTSDDKDLHRVYEVGKEIFTYKSKEDLLQKVKFLLANEDVCTQARIHSRKKCMAEHTWEKRFEKVFKMAGMLEA